MKRAIAPVLCLMIGTWAVWWLPVAAALSEEPKADVVLERVAVTAVDLFVRVRDADGRTPGQLEAKDFRVVEDGAEQTVIGVERVVRATEAGGAGPSKAAAVGAEDAVGWFTVIYFDQALCGRKAIKAAAESLADQAARLVKLGPVEVVLAHDEAEIVQPATRDEGAVAEALRRVAKKARGQSQVSAVRRKYLQAVADEAEAGAQITPRGGGGAGPAGRPGSVEGIERRGAASRGGDNSRQLQIRSAVLQERAIIESRRDLLLDLLSGYRLRSPRALILVSDGYDPDPKDFYLAGVTDRLESRLAAELEAFDLSASIDEAARVLAGSNWTVVGVALGELGAGIAAPASSSGGAASEGVGSGQTSSARGGARFLLSSQLEPLTRLARESGGELLTSEREIENALVELEDGFRLTYQSSRPPDGKIHAVEVQALTPGHQVRAARWVGSETPEEVAAHRARLIAEGRRLGDLPLEAMVLFDSAESGNNGATVAARLHLAPLEGIREHLRHAGLRVTTAFYFPDRTPFVHHAVVADQDLAAGAHWGHSTHVTLPADTGAVVVVVEELTTGSWGGSVAPRVRPE